jgi:hypothetical protein
MRFRLESGAGDFYPKRPDRVGGQPDSYASGIMWLKQEAEHSSPTSAEFKIAWNCTYTPLYVFTLP